MIHAAIVAEPTGERLKGRLGYRPVGAVWLDSAGPKPRMGLLPFHDARPEDVALWQDRVEAMQTGGRATVAALVELHEQSGRDFLVGAVGWYTSLETLQAELEDAQSQLCGGYRAFRSRLLRVR
jgi:hypothetical protein